MAIYHLTMKTGSKNKGQSGRAKSDYICREGKFKNDCEELLSTIDLNLPSWAQSGSHFWSRADEFERANARIFRELEFALPIEMNQSQHYDLVSDFVGKIIGSDFPTTIAIHKGGVERTNPHAHVIFSERQNDGLDRTPENYFKRANTKNPSLGGAKKTRKFIPKETLYEVRKIWADCVNEHLCEIGVSQRVDHRSFEERGIHDRLPQIHLGPHSLAALERGVLTTRFKKYQDIEIASDRISSMCCELRGIEDELKKEKLKIVRNRTLSGPSR
ncbi:MobA/MobL family protein [Vibrio fortis]|uniref:MobA/MobL family protein n=1 Tax=Vibrio fortis TaxID=212667 RepID=UPI0038CD28EA